MSNSFPKLISSQVFIDQRGSMQILFEGNDFDSKIIKITSSHKGVLRGFHYQTAPHMQRKKIYVLDGEIQDVVIRIGENGIPTGDFVENFISPVDGICELTIPSNWAHAYLTLSEQSRVLYVCDEVYGSEISFNPVTSFNGWKVPKQDLIISDKDLR